VSTSYLVSLVLLALTWAMTASSFALHGMFIS
jgi:hypothetical protein